MVQGTPNGDALHQRTPPAPTPGGPRRTGHERYRRGRHFVATSLAVLAAISVAACGSSSSTASHTVSGSGSLSSSSSAATADVSAAKTQTAAYSGHPSAFPVDTPLSKPLPKGSKFVYLQAADPIGAELAQLLKPAVAAVGGTFVAINAGSTAAAAQAAASSALADKPAVVLVPAFVPSEFGGKLRALQAAGAKIVGAGMINAAPYGVQFVVGGTPFNVRSGRLLADWVVANQGAKASPVFYTVPELSFTAVMYQAFKAQMAKLCPSCNVRSVPVSVTTIGSTAPQTIVNDLQSHTSTNVAVFSSQDMAQGLPAAMSSAGVKVTTIGSSPTPENLNDIKSAGITAGLGVDLATYTWEMVDAGARLALGATPPAGDELAPVRFLEQKDITFNTSHGYIGYPDFAQRFSKLWHP